MFVLIYNDDKMKFDKSIKIEDFKNRSQYKNDVGYRDTVDKLLAIKETEKRLQKHLVLRIVDVIVQDSNFHDYDYAKDRITTFLEYCYKPSRGEKELTGKDIIKIRDILLSDIYGDD